MILLYTALTISNTNLELNNNKATLIYTPHTINQGSFTAKLPNLNRLFHKWKIVNIVIALGVALGAAIDSHQKIQIKSQQ